MKIKKNSSEEIIISIIRRRKVEIRTDGKVKEAENEDILAEVDFHFDVCGRKEELMPLFSGPFWSAIIWERSVQVMCNYMESHRKEFAHKQIVELGCGLGVPGIVAGITCDAAEVFLTDRAEDLKVLENAFKANGELLESGVQCRFHPVAYDWAQSPPTSVKGDVIIAVECVSADVYGQESLMWLINAFQAVAKRKQLVTVYLCSARRKDDGLDEVLNYINTEIAGDEKPLLLQQYCMGDVELYQASIWIGS
jgi:predicted nicotinamide N-methyase